MSQDTETLYRDVPDGAIFKALKNDIIDSRVVSNAGTWKKIGNSHSTEIHSGKDAIFDLEMPCHVITLRPARAIRKPKPVKRSFGERLSRLGKVTVVKEKA